MRLSPMMFAAALAVLPATLPATSEAQTLDRIRETGEVKLGFRTDAAPLSFAAENGAPAGYTPLICAGVAQEIANVLKMEKLEVVFEPVDATNRFDKVASGEIDLLCGAATITLRRRELVDFSDPIYVDGVAILAGLDAGSTFEDYAGKRIGVRDGTTTQESVDISLKAAGIEAEMVAFAAHTDGLAAMESGEIDAYFADQSILFQLYFSSNMQDKFKLSNEILTIEKHGLAMARGDSDFRLLVDSALSRMYLSGEMEKIYGEALPGADPGLAMRALHLIAPTNP